MKNTYKEGSAEHTAFEQGSLAERTRLLKVINKYHTTFCQGELSEHDDCTKTMQIRYLYEFATESRTLK
jgi:hypothetical protein